MLNTFIDFLFMQSALALFRALWVSRLLVRRIDELYSEGLIAIDCNDLKRLDAAAEKINESSNAFWPIFFNPFIWTLRQAFPMK